MNDKDKEPFKSWFEQDRKEFEAREPATYTDSDEWCMRKGWIAACKYKDKEYSNLMDAMSKTSQYNFKLQAENKKLREALQSIGYFHLRPEQVIRTAREALKKVNKE
jgi:hypothetical protein